jgi:ADP-glucose pyrophosphorylase
VRSLVEKPAEPTSDLVFTAFCLFRVDALQRALAVLANRPAGDWHHDISRDVLPLMISEGCRVQAFPVGGYWADIGTLERYLLGHLELIRSPAALPLKEVPRTLTGARPELTSLGGVITSDALCSDSYVRESVVYPGSMIEPGARVERSVVLPHARVSADVWLVDTVVLPGEHVTQSRSGLAALTK